MRVCLCLSGVRIPPLLTECVCVPLLCLKCSFGFVLGFLFVCFWVFFFVLLFVCYFSLLPLPRSAHALMQSPYLPAKKKKILKFTHWHSGATRCQDDKWWGDETLHFDTESTKGSLTLTLLQPAGLSFFLYFSAKLVDFVTWTQSHALVEVSACLTSACHLHKLVPPTGGRGP